MAARDEYDGYRKVLAIGGREAGAYPRSGLDSSDRFAPRFAEAARLKVDPALIDGEAVALDRQGRSTFQALRNALKGSPDQIAHLLSTASN